jgi:hypothetical protein
MENEKLKMNNEKWEKKREEETGRAPTLRQAQCNAVGARTAMMQG